MPGYTRTHAGRARRFVAPALSLFTLLVPAVGAAAGPGTTQPPAKPEVRSSAYYVFDAGGSSVLAARREGTAAPIASITKLMTSLVVLEAGQPLAEMLTITAEDVRGTAGNGSRLAPGARLSRGDLMHLALMSSENRAAHALCRSYPGGPAACIRAMNDKAAALGMDSATFVEPTGLSRRNVASPRDLATLVLAASQNTTIRAYSTDASHSVHVRGRRLDFHNTNLLVDNPGWEVSVQKTGYISEAGRCLVMQAVIDSRPVVIVLLNSSGKLTRIADARRIRAWIESRHRSVASTASTVGPLG